MIEVTNFGVDLARPWEQVNILSSAGDKTTVCSCGCSCSCSCESAYRNMARYSPSRSSTETAVCFPEL